MDENGVGHIEMRKTAVPFSQLLAEAGGMGAGMDMDGLPSGSRGGSGVESIPAGGNLKDRGEILRARQARADLWTGARRILGNQRGTIGEIHTAPAREFSRTEGLSTNKDSLTVSEMMKIMRTNGWQMPPIDVLQHGERKYILDGHHRVEAARRVGIDVQYRLVSPDNVVKFGYRSVNDVISAWAYAPPNRLRLP